MPESAWEKKSLVSNSGVWITKMVIVPVSLLKTFPFSGTRRRGVAEWRIYSNGTRE